MGEALVAMRVKARAVGEIFIVVGLALDINEQSESIANR